MADRKQLPPRPCTFCENHETDAAFVLVVNGKERAVHKYCGEKLLAAAPEGAEVRLVRAGELAREKREAREASEEASVQAFWAGKFAAATARKQKGGPHAQA